MNRQRPVGKCLTFSPRREKNKFGVFFKKQKQKPPYDTNLLSQEG